jgi:CheY-like chemotaxis protein
MTQKQLARIFDAFIQADSLTSKKFGGTGLGLAITKKFCEMMHGDVTVESEQEKGTVFTVILPADVGEAIGKPLVEKADGDKKVEDEDEYVPESNLVLVIDDDPTVHDLFIQYLKRGGYEVATASNADDGIKLARELVPAAITLDVLMPEKDGWNALKELKTDPITGDIPVVMVTMVDDKNLGYTLGASDYLIKPVSRDRLLATLQKYHIKKATGRVMVVEDDKHTRELLARMVTKEGYDVGAAENGKIALNLLRKFHPDIILLDLMMPVMDGFEFINEVNKIPKWEKIPIVIITSKDLSTQDRDMLEGSVKRIIQKGEYDRESLAAEVYKAIKMSTEK